MDWWQEAPLAGSATGRPETAARRPQEGTRTYAQIVGGVVLGLGLAAAIDLHPGLIFSGYTIGLGVLVVCLGLFLPGEPLDSGTPGPCEGPRPPVR